MRVSRHYRSWVGSDDLVRFRVVVEQTDLAISCDRDLEGLARDAVVEARSQVKSAICNDPAFATSLEPIRPADEPGIARDMALAAQAWSVGPMAAVAGAIAEYVGNCLVRQCERVAVENGGDIFVRSAEPVCFGLFAGQQSPFSKVTFTLDARRGLGVCTSSGVVGPSLSFGRADAVVAIAAHAAWADAAATSIANRVRAPHDVDSVVESERERGALDGLIVCCGDRMGAFGEMTFGHR